MPIQMKLELVPVPVSDVDRAKAFYTEIIGFHADHDHQVNGGLRFVQLTPPGSACSIAIGTGLVELFGARWGAFVLVTIYGGASVYFELFPQRAERLLRGSRARALTYQPDLDGPRDPGIAAVRRDAVAPPSQRAPEIRAAGKRKRARRRQRG